MLVGKISPTAKIVFQETPFIHDEKDVQYMTAIANQYVLDAESTTFNVLFGEIPAPVPPDEPQPEPFNVLYTYVLTLTSEQLSTWGTDDSSLLQIVAEELGVEILEFVNV
jgi:hypothetical protein